MGKPLVAIAHGRDPRRMVREALERIGAARAVDVSGRVVIKPNFVEPRKPETGVTTDPQVIAAVVEWCRDLGARDITIAESNWSRENTQRAFELVGLPQLAARLGARLLNLFDDEHVEVEIPGALSLSRVRLARTVLEADCLVNLPKLKCHCLAYVTLGIKNLMGAVFPDKSTIHHKIHSRLRDLATVLRPAVTVIDGLVGSERHETSGSPVESNVIIAGLDPVATDAVGCLAMGIDPADVEHLRLASEAGLGEYRRARITLRGAPIEQVCKPYRRPHSYR
jgi:uncharacterized protein (DUF362 family)